MGSGGEDLLISPKARELFPFSVECKSYANFVVYKHYEQAINNASNHIPLLIIKADRKKPLAVLDLKDFLNLL